MTNCLFVADLHGRLDRYRKLFHALETAEPQALFIGGDLFPHGLRPSPDEPDDFFKDVLELGLASARKKLGDHYPRVFVILGNDDSRAYEPAMLGLQSAGLLDYIHNDVREFAGHKIYGYAFVPPTPFLFKDWEKYDVSRYVDPGCISPEEGFRSTPVPKQEIMYGTIQEDLANLAGNEPQDLAVWLIHTPPYKTALDRAALDGKAVDHVPLDVHVGSIAVRRFVEQRQPKLSMHGHIHESTRLTGSWQDKIGSTFCLSAAHDGPELAVIRFNLEDPASAVRELL